MSARDRAALFVCLTGLVCSVFIPHVCARGYRSAAVLDVDAELQMVNLPELRRFRSVCVCPIPVNIEFDIGLLRSFDGLCIHDIQCVELDRHFHRRSDDGRSDLIVWGPIRRKVCHWITVHEQGGDELRVERGSMTEIRKNNFDLPLSVRFQTENASILNYDPWTLFDSKLLQSVSGNVRSFLVSQIHEESKEGIASSNKNRPFLQRVVLGLVSCILCALSYVLLSKTWTPLYLHSATSMNIDVRMLFTVALLWTGLGLIFMVLGLLPV